jgi:DNA-binding response OmpR family regulator
MSESHLGEVLIVEDTPSSLKLLADLLAGAGYLVRQAPDGELALWSAQARPPELILLDIRMPGIDGFEVCRRLKAAPLLRDIPVIFLSAQHDTEDKVRGFRAGAIDFIGKPYQSEEVLARTAAHVALTRSQRALARANAELTSAREELRRAEKLAALGAMVAGVAHQLNTPIGNCVLTASVLEQRVQSFGAAASGAAMGRSVLTAFVADVEQASAILQRNLAGAARLIDSFKQVASAQDGALRARFDLAQLLADIGAPLTPRLRAAGATLELAAPPGIIMDSYPGALDQVLGQLLQNALLHGVREGRPIAIRIDAGVADGHLTLSCSDDGAGIAAALLERVFEPFFTTRMGQNTGLGLHIAHNIVTNVLGGTLAVTSGAGATSFVLRCPCIAPALDSHHPPPLP